MDPSNNSAANDVVECILINSTRSVKDIIWSGAIPSNVLHNGTYFASNFTAMETIWEHSSSICHSDHRENTSGPRFPPAVPEFFSVELTVVWVLVIVLLFLGGVEAAEVGVEDV